MDVVRSRAQIPSQISPSCPGRETEAQVFREMEKTSVLRLVLFLHLSKSQLTIPNAENPGHSLPLHGQAPSPHLPLLDLCSKLYSFLLNICPA